MPKEKIQTFDPKYATAFVDLNREWIEQHFEIEETDLMQLQHPHENIIRRGGEIFFVVENNIPVGTCAMVPHGANQFELAKMAVAPRCRGKGYGDLLMKAAIDWAREKKASKISLLSNTVLTPAITLYKKHGFKVVCLGPNAEYNRCNIEMVLDLEIDHPLHAP